MELYDYYLLLRKRQRVFWTILMTLVLLASLWQMTQKDRYEATLLLNISRSGSQETNDYTYDGFYRLQADERFADTVVRWLGSPRGADDILREAGMDTETYRTNDLAKFFTSGRLSSQVIRVEYLAMNVSSAEKISGAVMTIVNRYTNELNRDAKDPSWFVVTGNDPVIRDARVPLLKVLIIAVLLGVFLGFWGAIVGEYWEKQKTRQGGKDTRC